MSADGVGVALAETDRALSKALNRDCFCLTLDRPALDAALVREASEVDLAADLFAARPHLVSSTPVFLAKPDRKAMLDVVAAVEAAAQLPAYRAAALARNADPTAQSDFGPLGAFMGYDFHITDAGPKLIEINTNAGGAFVNAFLARARLACCAPVRDALRDKDAPVFEQAALDMFAREWRLQRGSAPLRSVAIVDDAPQAQYLYPEFVLAQAFFEHAGFEAFIVDANELVYGDGGLFANGRQIDLVYNRLVDFALSAPSHEALRQAYLDGAVVATPNPRHHALLADKRNLVVFSDADRLVSWGLAPGHAEALRTIPKSVTLTPCNTDALWAARKQYYFKPADGHAGKAVYRGDKLTRGVWAEIQTGNHVAQENTPPSERMIEIDGVRVARKLDVRLYTYDGALLIAAARLYRGQTTNFRTPGGGFAPVFFV